jgi:hypothetical protein
MGNASMQNINELIAIAVVSHIALPTVLTGCALQTTNKTENDEIKK